MFGLASGLVAGSDDPGRSRQRQLPVEQATCFAPGLGHRYDVRVGEGVTLPTSSTSGSIRRSMAYSPHLLGVNGKPTSTSRPVRGRGSRR